MTAWDGIMLRGKPGIYEKRLVSSDLSQAVLDAMKPGREYTVIDLRNRLKDRGRRASDGEITSALKYLTQSGQVVSGPLPDRRTHAYRRTA